MGDEVALAELTGLKGIQPGVSPLYELYISNRRLVVVMTAGSRSAKVMEKGAESLAVAAAGSLFGVAGAIISAKARPRLYADRTAVKDDLSVDFQKLNEHVRDERDSFSAPYDFVHAIKVRRSPWYAGSGYYGMLDVDLGKFGRTFGLTKVQYNALASVLPTVNALEGKLTVTPATVPQSQEPVQPLVSSAQPPSGSARSRSYRKHLLVLGLVAVVAIAGVTALAQKPAMPKESTIKWQPVGSYVTYSSITTTGNIIENLTFAMRVTQNDNNWATVSVDMYLFSYLSTSPISQNSPMSSYNVSVPTNSPSIDFASYVFGGGAGPTSTELGGNVIVNGKAFACNIEHFDSGVSNNFDNAIYVENTIRFPLRIVYTSNGNSTALDIVDTNISGL